MSPTGPPIPAAPTPVPGLPIQTPLVLPPLGSFLQPPPLEVPAVETPTVSPPSWRSLCDAPLHPPTGVPMQSPLTPTGGLSC